jgi:hypothetical protein
MQGREEPEGYGISRKSRAKKLAAKQWSVKPTSTVLLPILDCAVENELKIYQPAAEGPSMLLATRKAQVKLSPGHPERSRGIAV